MASPDSFNKAIIDALVGRTPDKGGVDIAVVMCGYADEMKKMFDSVNPGLARRFPAATCRFTFSPYTEAELRRIFVDAARERGLVPNYAAAVAAGRQLKRESALRNFGNAGKPLVCV